MERLIFPVTKKEAEKKGIKYSSQENKEALFPSQLRELREKKGVSQATLAQDLGVSKSTIGLYETGDTLPDAKTLHDLAVYFDVSADYLLGLSPVPSIDMDIQKICEYTGLDSEAVIKIAKRKNSHPTIDVYNFLIRENKMLRLFVNYCAGFTLQKLGDVPYKYIPLKNSGYPYMTDIQFAAIIRHLPKVRSSFEEHYENNENFVKQSIYNYLLNNADIKECKKIVHEDYVDFDEQAEWLESYYQSSDYKDFMSEPPEDNEIDIDEFIESQMEEEASVNDFLSYYYKLHQNE